MPFSKNPKRPVMEAAGVRLSNCGFCNLAFEYPEGVGRWRKYCSDKCRESAKQEFKDARLRAAEKCESVWCTRVCVRVGSGLCDACYCRRRRGEDISQPPKRKEYGYRYATGAGYIKLLVPGHPLADSSGMAFEHRVVAFKRYGDGLQECYWCGLSLEWADAVVDHLDDSKDNNTPDNLVVACNSCNRARGAMLPYLRRLRPEAVERLVDCIRSTARGE